MNQQERDEYISHDWTGPGWKQLILDCDREMSEINPDYTILQIKEKFGGLRYYVEGHSDLFDIEEKYERLSFQICEECGSKLEVTTNRSNGFSWIKTYCKECRKKENNNAP